jgi:hypothetical protein
VARQQIPVLCASLPDLLRTSPSVLRETFADEAGRSFEELPSGETALALNVLRATDDLRAAVSAPTGDLVASSALPAPIHHGVALEFNFDHPIDLPNRFGLPRTSGGEGAPSPAIGPDGWEVLSPAAATDFEGTRSATFFIDLEKGSVRYVVPSADQRICSFDWPPA